jgi:nitrogen regulatory protein PII
LSLYIKDKDVETTIQIIRDSGQTGDAGDSYLAIFKAEKAYKLEDGNEEDKLIEII